ncbi:hypothetical protein R1flu_011091 [Riccia fluitans]|uniref:Uncharacterized protein n=1 Tax=Riccia fluitans TaxID=41844 RepID=A0ABD1Z9C1_9MARC
MVEGMDNADEDGGVQQLLRTFLDVQQRRASVYSLWHKGFADYLKTSSDDEFSKLCGQITIDFNECSRQVRDIIARLKDESVLREDLASVLEQVQVQESQKLRMTSVLQVLRKAGRPSERANVTEQRQQHSTSSSHVCSHGAHAEAEGLEMAQLEAEFDAAVKEATGSVQDAVVSINEHMEEIRYEIEDLEQKQSEILHDLEMSRVTL